MIQPIKITLCEFFKELSAASVNWALGNAGDKVRIETTFQIQNYVIDSIDNPITVNSTDGYLGDGWVVDPNNQFLNFNIGDYVYFFNYVTNTAIGSFYITDKLSNGEIRLNTIADGSGVAPLGGTPTLDTQGVFSNQTPITAVKYHYNWIENSASDNYLSYIDGSEQVFETSKIGSDTSTTQMLPLGPLTWQDGLSGSVTKDFSGSSISVCSITGINATIVGGVYTTTYKIVHYTKIPEYVIVSQIANEKLRIPPSDFQTVNKCWKFITQIEAMDTFTNPNYLIVQDFDSVLGNTGWRNENFNTGKTNYSIANLTYVNNALPIDSIQLDDSTTTIEFDIVNTIDTPFTTSTFISLGIFKVPADPSEYQLNNQLMDINFLFDRKKIQAAHSGAGDNIGGSYQIMSGITVTVTDSGHLHVLINVSMAAAVIASFKESATPQYLLRVAVQNSALATNASDLVALTVDMNMFTVVTADPGMIVIDPTVFIRHPEVNPATEGVSPGTGAIDATPVSWTISESVPPGGIQIVKNGTINHGANWITDLNTTMAAVATVWNGLSLGSMASWDVGAQSFTISPPVGSGAGPNGTTFHLESYSTGGGNGTVIYTPSGGDPSATLTFSGGVNATTLDVYPQDEIVACSDFYIESSTRLTNIILLSSVNAQIIAKNGSKSFELDQFLMLLSSIPLTGYTQQFDSQIPRVFNVPATSIRKFIEVKRRNDLDTGTRKYFSSNYPFLIRWETWTAVLGVDPSFFDSSLPNNGFNEWWFQYGQASGWSLYYNLIINATKDGIAQTYNQQVPFTIHDYASNSDYSTKNTLTFDPSTLSALLSGAGGAKQLIQGGGSVVTINGQDYARTGTMFNNMSGKTLIVGVFTKTTLPANAVVEMDVEVYQQGGIAGQIVYSSKWVSDGNSWFTSIDGSGKVVLYAYGDSVIALAYLDPSTPGFPINATAMSFSSRIFEIGGVLETDDGVPITTDDGVQIEVD